MSGIATAARRSAPKVETAAVAAFLWASFVGLSLALGLLGPAQTDGGGALLVAVVSWPELAIGLFFLLAAAIGEGRREPAAVAGLLWLGGATLVGWSVLPALWEGVRFAGAGTAVGLCLGVALALWRGMSLLARGSPLVGPVIAVVFGATLIWIWEALTVGYAVPPILLPSPSRILETFLLRRDVMWVDFFQTYVRSAIPGFLIGSAAGFLTAVAIDRSPFLQRGLLPLGSAVSAMPIVGIAPIMIMWFGFDWHSKAAVVVVMTFFPMMVNTLAGLQSTGAMEQDLMRSYAARYLPTLVKLRLPAAMPFVFNALKLNATLALIGAIVAEFFGTPVYGMGFRISTEVQRLNVDMVWATILVAAVAGSVTYAVLSLLERLVTFWHPSFRRA
jgi:NitT/TauT family transport system permease protein